MSICRFVAREIGIAGRNSMEMAQVDEIIDVIQDAIDANVSDDMFDNLILFAIVRM